MNWIEAYLYLHTFISICMEELSAVLMNKQITQTILPWGYEKIFELLKNQSLKLYILLLKVNPQISLILKEDVKVRQILMM